MNQHLYNIHKVPSSTASTQSTGTSSGVTSSTSASKPSQVMTQIRDYVLTKSKPNDKLHAKLKDLLGAGSKNEVGLILSERLINMPVETAPPMWRMMLDEVKQAVDKVNQEIAGRKVIPKRSFDLQFHVADSQSLLSIADRIRLGNLGIPVQLRVLLATMSYISRSCAKDRSGGRRPSTVQKEDKDGMRIQCRFGIRFHFSLSH